MVSTKYFTLFLEVSMRNFSAIDVSLSFDETLHLVKNILFLIYSKVPVAIILRDWGVCINQEALHIT